MILGIDIGNTQIFFGLIDKNRTVEHFRMNSPKSISADEVGIFITHYFAIKKINPVLEGVVISSVRPSLNYAFLHASVKYFNKEPLFIKPGIKTGLNINIENPKELGADRIANSVAANLIYGKPAIVVDFGTATTIDLIDNNSNFTGGMIFPGIKTSFKALAMNTEKLPFIEITEDAPLIGKNSVEAIQSGIINGAIGSVTYLIKETLKSEGMKDAVIIGTGGLAYLIQNRAGIFHHIDPDLIMKGMYLIFKKNFK